MVYEYIAWCPLFFDDNVTGDTFLFKLQDRLMPQIKCLDERLSEVGVQVIDSMSSTNIENSEISQQQSFPVLNSQQSTSQNNEHSPYKILEVWKSNLNEVFEEIRQVVKKYPFIAMDTEFPGVVARPIGNFASVSEFHYQSLKVNVDLLQIIQLGLSFFDEHGNPPVATSTYQFNFNFNMA
ncbi:hypothetical protein GJ496_008661 [Pomphorhynchus laevis]|nr:hypothetical protein GJ496_008661 [Pomphorhynchus laevis]